MDISAYTSGLVERKGIWYSSAKVEISYPDEGNEICMQLEDSSFWFQHRNDCIKSNVSRFSGNQTFWDIGGGNGYVARGLQDIGIETILVEPGENGVLNAKSRGIKNVICSTLENSGIKPSSMESAGAFDVIEHIENDLRFLNKIHFYLKDQGVLYITVPAFNFLWSNEDDYAGHFRRYNLKSIGEVLQKANFELIYQTYIFSMLTFPIFLARTIPSFLGFNKRSGDLKKHQEEHHNKSPFKEIIDYSFRWELSQIEKQKSIPFGSSCLIVAIKHSS